jgi:hypothetical protein
MNRAARHPQPLPLERAVPTRLASVRGLRVAALGMLAALLASSAGAASISGVCPDGSIFIVQDRNRIPCRDAKEVAPDEVPPLRPEYLPRPYSWQVYRESQNPNNPYNLIDSARRVRELQGAPPVGDGLQAAGGTPGAPGGGAASTVSSPPFTSAPPVPSTPTLALSDDEIRDLFLIVELSQRQAPARFVKEDAQGEPSLELSFAWSEAFAAHFDESFPGARGPVVLFTVLAHQADTFHPNLTFVQGHETFRPRGDDPAQMGMLEGEPGDLPAEGVLLGYVVLPERMDPARDLDVYWNDRRIETVLRP